nr:4393_t:CDS:2 [Entrophospora candida]
MVATNAFGLGINTPDIGLVVHYDFPMGLREYTQESGQAARDGHEYSGEEETVERKAQLQAGLKN